MRSPISPSLAAIPITLVALTAGSEPCAGQACAAEDMFTAASRYTADPTTYGNGGLAAADLDGDGDLDAVTVALGPSRPATVFLNNGDAAPTITTMPDSSGGSWAVDLADLNGDSLPDFVRALRYDGIEVRLGSGDGTFGVPQVYSLGNSARGVRAIDMNGDAAPDLVAVDRDSEALGVFIATGDGTFLPAVTYATGQLPQHLESVDLDLDGSIDIVVTNSGGGSVSVFMNQGDGALVEERASIVVGGTPLEVATGDFNDDGHPDLIVSMNEQSNPVLLGRGDGTFADGEPLFAPEGAQRTTVLDSNGDGWPDLACYTPDTEIVRLFHGRGDGTFESADAYLAASTPRTIAADWTGDEIDDLLISGTNHGLRVAAGNGDGTFEALGAAAVGGASVATADMNGDGTLDLIGTRVGPFGDQAFLVSLGLGDGTFAAPAETVVDHQVYSIACGDLDGDGTMDVVGAGAEYDTGYATVVLLGAGDGTLTLAGTVPTPFTARNVTLADVDEDGHLDILLAHLGFNGVSLERGNGDGTFQPREWLGLGRHDIVVEDLDGDGHLDLASVTSPQGQTGVLLVRLGNGDGTFQSAQNFDLPLLSLWSLGGGLTAADVIGDGVLDMLAVGSTEAGEIAIAICLGTVDGLFAAAATIPTGQTEDGWRTLVVDDFDGDGVPDLAAAVWQSSDGPVSVLRGLGDGSYAPPAFFWNGRSHVGMVSGDFDANGAMDLAVANINSGNSTIMLNRCAGATACTADVDGDDNVGFGDLLGVMTAWGACDDCPEDLDADGIVGFDDVLLLIASWGPCP